LAIGANTYVLQSNGSVPQWVAPSTLSGGTASSLANAVTFNNAGSGAASGTTFNGSSAVTVSYNTIGAPAAGAIAATSVKVANGIVSLDNRNANDLPGERSAGLYVDFKANTTNSLSDGGTYNGVLTFRSYGTSNSDFTGGIAQQIAYTDNNNLWHRGSTNSSTWGTWYKIIDTLNSSTAHVFRATVANGSSGVETVRQPASATYFPAFVDSNNATAAAELVYTTSSFTVNPSTGGVGVTSLTATGGVYAGGTSGFYSTSFAANVRNPIWRFGNADGFGLSYFQGSAGFAGTAVDTLGIHFGTATAAGSTVMFNQDGKTYINGSLGVGTNGSGVTGEIRATNEITAYYTSDARLKENVRLIADPITKIMKIRGVNFDWIDKHIEERGGEDGYFVRKHDVGVIAQEIAEILPEAVATRDNGFLAVKYEKIVPLLIEVVKAQQKEINQILQTLKDMASK
jgi:hypothetical protein